MHIHSFEDYVLIKLSFFKMILLKSVCSSPDAIVFFMELLNDFIASTLNLFYAFQMSSKVIHY